MTYSLSVTGVGAHNPFEPAALTVDDSVALAGGQALASAQNTQFLCKRPDGSQAWYTYDAERSIPGVRRVLKRV